MNKGLTKTFLFFLSFFTLLPCTSLYTNGDSASSTARPSNSTLSYGEIGRIYLRTFGKPLPVKKSIKTSADLQKLLQLSEHEKRSLVFQLFARHEMSAHASEDPTSQESSCDARTVAADLNLLAYQSKNVEERGNSLMARVKIGHATLFGEATLAHMLTHPLATIKALTDRQALIQACNRNDIRLICDEILSTISSSEGMLLSCFAKISHSEQTVINKLYFSNSWLTFLNKSEWTLGLCARTKEFRVPVPIIALKLGPALGMLLCGAPFREMCAIEWEYLKHLGIPLISPLASYRTLMKEKATMQMNDEHKATLVSAAADVGILWLTKSFWHMATEQHTTTTHIQQKLMACATLVTAVDKLEQLAKKCPELQEKMRTWQSHKRTFSPQFQKFLGMLRTATFRGAPSYFSRVGRVHVAYALLQETKDELIAYMQVIGMLDAHRSIAKLYETSQQSQIPYNFVTFRDSREGPYIKAVGFKNPMLSGPRVVANNIEFGNHQGLPRIAIVTGSNSAGKSTIMITGLTSILWLAHTLTVASAEHFEVTPFKHISTSLKLTDDILLGVSHSAAECNHRNKIYHDITQATADGKYAFVAIDELFEGFPPKVGSKALHSFAKELAKNSLLISAIATQFQNHPTQLEAESNGVCKNMRVDVEIDKDGRITRPYKIEDGVSKVNIGEALLNENGVFGNIEAEDSVNAEEIAV